MSDNEVTDKIEVSDSTPLTVGILKALLDLQSSQLNTNIKKIEDNLKKHSDGQISEIREDVNGLRNQLKDKDEEIRLLKRENERQKRQRNIILHKVPESETNARELKSIIIRTILSECKVDISNYIDTIFRLGKKTENRVRPVLVSLTSIDQKMNIMWNKKQHNSNLEISEDYPKDVSEERKRISPMLVTLRELNYKNVHLRYDKLFVDGVECSEDMYSQLVSLKQQGTCVKGDVATIAEERPSTSSKLASSESLNASFKRSRSKSVDEEPNRQTTLEKKKIKTTIVGTSSSINSGVGKNPIKEALKRQVQMQSISPLTSK